MRLLTHLMNSVSKSKIGKSLIGLSSGLMIYAGALGLESRINAEDVSAKKTSTSDLVAYWSFDSDASESTGKNILNGTFVGNAHVENAGYAPISGNEGCLVLDGAPSRVNLPAPLAPILGELKEGTIEAWGYLTSSTYPDGAVIFNSGIPARYTDINLWIDKENNQTRVGLNTVNFQFPLNNFQLNKWHHYAWSWSDSKLQFWMDNNLIKTQPNSRSVPFTGSEAEIGSDDQEWGYWIGKIDEVKIWNRFDIPTPTPVPTPTPNPVELISPKGGEKWNEKSYVGINWKLNEKIAGDSVGIELWGKNGLIHLGYDYAENGQRNSSMFLPLMPGGDDYTLSVYSLWNPSLYAESKPITIIGKGIKLISPNGGERWKRGSQQMIHWEANPDIAGTAVRFELWDREKKVTDFYDKNKPNQLEYGWDPDGEDINNVTIPNVRSGSDYKVRVISAWDSQYWDDSDNSITIKK